VIETRIYDNFLPDDIFREFTDPLFKDATMPLWFTGNVLPPEYMGEDEKDSGAGFYQLVHTYYGNTNGVVGMPTESFGAVEPIVMLVAQKIKDINDPSQVALFRAKLNVIPRTHENQTEGFHCDRTFEDAKGVERLCPHAVGLFYLNTTNGPTVFEDGERVECVANRLVIFDGLRRHTSSSCTDQKIRAALNLNYFVVGGVGVELNSTERGIVHPE
jgi:hypothetical protein